MKRTEKKVGELVEGKQGKMMSRVQIGGKKTKQSGRLMRQG